MCGVAASLCAGDEQTPSLVEKLYSQHDAKVTKKSSGGGKPMWIATLPWLEGVLVGDQHYN